MPMACVDAMSSKKMRQKKRRAMAYRVPCRYSLATVNITLVRVALE